MAADRLTVFTITWIARLFGAAILAFGMLEFVQFCLGHFTIVGHGSPTHPSTPADGWLAWPLLLGGAIFLCFRSSGVIHLSAKRLVRNRGWGLWGKTSALDLSSYTQVTVGPSRRRNDRIMFQVALRSPTGSEELAVFMRHRDAVRFAKVLADAMHLALTVSDPAGTPIDTASIHDRAGNPLVDGTHPTQLPMPPGRSRITVVEERSITRINVAMAPAGRVFLFYYPTVPLMSALVFHARYRHDVAHLTGSTFARTLCIFLVPFIVTCLTMSLPALGSYQCGIWGGIISVDATTGARAWGRTIPLSALRAITIRHEGLRGLRITTADSTYLWAIGQSKPDLDYLREVLRYLCRKR